MRDSNPFAFIEDDEDEILFCPKCERAGVRSKLGPRIYEDEVPYDADMWYQCPKCGQIIPIYETKEEGEYVPIVDIVSNPFDAGSEFESVDKRKKKNRLKKDEEKDKELAGEKGEINILYDSSGNY